jgi:hypothetical protein
LLKSKNRKLIPLLSPSFLLFHSLEKTAVTPVETAVAPTETVAAVETGEPVLGKALPVECASFFSFSCFRLPFKRADASSSPSHAPPPPRHPLSFLLNLVRPPPFPSSLPQPLPTKSTPPPPPPPSKPRRSPSPLSPLPSPLPPPSRRRRRRPPTSLLPPRPPLPLLLPPPPPLPLRRRLSSRRRKGSFRCAAVVTRRTTRTKVLQSTLKNAGGGKERGDVLRKEGRMATT